VNFAAEIHQAKLMERKGGRAKLLFDESDRAHYFAGRDVILRQALQRTERDEIYEAIKTLAPAGFGANETQALPVAKTVRLKTKNAASFRPGISFRQFLKTPAPKKILKRLCTES